MSGTTNSDPRVYPTSVRIPPPLRKKMDSLREDPLFARMNNSTMILTALDWFLSHRLGETARTEEESR